MEEVAIAISVVALLVALAALRAARRPHQAMDAPMPPPQWARDEPEGPDPYRGPGEAVSVVLVARGPRKIHVIKALRDATGIGLKEARDLVEAQVPVTVAESLPSERAEALVAALQAAGATAELS